MKEPIVYLDNRWVPLKSARISPLDHGFLYGDGVFETVRSYWGRPFKLAEHLERLVLSCRRIGLSIPKPIEKFPPMIDKILARNKIKEGMIRIAVTRGPGPVGLDPGLCPVPTLLVMAFPFTPPPESLYAKGIALEIVKTVRNIPEAIPSEIKSSNFLNNILAKMEAGQSGADEGIFLNHKGHVAEGTISNIFCVRRNVLTTPSLKAGILDGVTRSVVIEIAEKNGIPVEETLFRQKSLLAAEECFITSTGYEIMPATKIRGIKIGTGVPGALTEKLMALFRKEVKEALLKLCNSKRF
jgi:branched-chain amino acid aminotransferase